MSRRVLLLALPLLLSAACTSEDSDGNSNSGVDPSGTGSGEDTDAQSETEEGSSGSTGEAETGSSSGSSDSISSVSGPPDETDGDGPPEFDPDQNAVVLPEDGFVLFAGSTAVTCEADYDDCGSGAVVRIALPEPVELQTYDVTAKDVEMIVVDQWINDCEGNGSDTGEFPIIAGQIEVTALGDDEVSFRLSNLDAGGDPGSLSELEVAYTAVVCS